MKKWFMSNDEFDKQIRDKFGDLLELASQKKLDHWKDEPNSLMGLILILD